MKSKILYILSILLMLLSTGIASANMNNISLNSISNQDNSNAIESGIQGGDWYQFINNYANSRYQSSSTVNSNNIGNLTQVWTFQTNHSVYSTPVVRNGTVYFVDYGGNVSSVNLTNGSLNWQVHIGSRFSATPSLMNGFVYVAGNGPPFGTPEVFALSPVDGHTIWRTVLKTTMQNIFTSPIYYNGLLYTGTSDCDNENNSSCKGQIYALEANKGTPVWSFITAGTAGGAGVWGSVVVDGQINQLYFGTGNTYSKNGSPGYAYSILSLNASTGSLKWYYQVYNSSITGGDLDFGSTPNLFGVYINGVLHKVVGLGSKDGNYYVWDRLNGTLLGKFGNLIAGGSIIGLAGFLYDPLNITIFVPAYNGTPPSKCCGVLTALKPVTGAKVWKFSTSGRIIGSVSEVPGAILFGDIVGNLYAVDITKGKLLFNTTLPGGIYTGVTSVEGHVIVATTTGIYAYAPK